MQKVYYLYESPEWSSGTNTTNRFNAKIAEVKSARTDDMMNI